MSTAATTASFSNSNSVDVEHQAETPALSGHYQNNNQLETIIEINSHDEEKDALLLNEENASDKNISRSPS